MNRHKGREDALRPSESPYSEGKAQRLLSQLWSAAHAFQGECPCGGSCTRFREDTTGVDQTLGRCHNWCADSNLSEWNFSLGCYSYGRDRKQANLARVTMCICATLVLSKSLYSLTQAKITLGRVNAKMGIWRDRGGQHSGTDKRSAFPRSGINIISKNIIPRRMERDCPMVIGLDTSHPPQGSQFPTTAAMVFSVDDHLAEYRGYVNYQVPRKELIDGLEQWVLVRGLPN